MSSRHQTQVLVGNRESDQHSKRRFNNSRTMQPIYIGVGVCLCFCLSSAVASFGIRRHSPQPAEDWN
eukprot:5498284-Amphidinium_carterae.1